MAVTDWLTPAGKRLADLRKMLEQNPSVYVGVLDSGKGSEDRGGLTNGMLAVIHEFGQGRSPARPWISATFDRVRARTERNARVLVERILDGAIGVEQALGVIGATFAADIKATVVGGEQIPPPNAPSTLERKLAKTRAGSSGDPRTLVDTGRMLGAVSWLVDMLGSRR